MKSTALWLFILLVPNIFLYDCQKEYLPVGDLEPGVALTFDDAYLDQWVELLPMFQKYGVQATFFICTACSDNPLDTTKVIQIYEAGNEIGSHSLHHDYIRQYIRTHSLSDYYKFEIAPTLHYFDSLNIPVTSFAYPYGDHTRESDKFLSDYFQKIRGICSLQPSENGAFILHKNKKLVFGSYIDRPTPYHLQDFKRAILLAKEHRAVLVLIGHKPDLISTDDWTFLPSLLDSICNFTVQQKMKFYRMQDL
jgi:peptidoglycan-N-acetylglucosamine deacetylase